MHVRAQSLSLNAATLPSKVSRDEDSCQFVRSPNASKASTTQGVLGAVVGAVVGRVVEESDAVIVVEICSGSELVVVAAKVTTVEEEVESVDAAATVDCDKGSVETGTGVANTVVYSTDTDTDGCDIVVSEEDVGSNGCVVESTTAVDGMFSPQMGLKLSRRNSRVPLENTIPLTTPLT